MMFGANMYFSAKLKNSPEIIELLKKGTPCFDIYLVCINMQGNNLFEIYHSTEAFKPYAVNKELLAIGISQGRKDACDLLMQILESYIKQYGSLENIKSNLNRVNI